MPTILRGQVYIADLDPVRGHEQAGRRPVLVLTSGQSNDRSKLAIVLPITGSRPRVEFPYAVPLQSIEMPIESWILTRQIRTISEDRMLNLMGRISNEEMRKVVTALLGHLLPQGSEFAIGNFPGLT